MPTQDRGVEGIPTCPFIDGRDFIGGRERRSFGAVEKIAVIKNSGDGVGESLT